jgi:hypothetical protein
MGAWGAGNFENDTALDWIGDLKESRKLRLVESAISDVLKARRFIDSNQCCIGLAAAEIVAALIGNPLDKLPIGVPEWIQSHKKAPNDKLIENTRKAVKLIRFDEKSELKLLWEEGGDTPTDWYSAIDDLLTRLG